MKFKYMYPPGYVGTEWVLVKQQELHDAEKRIAELEIFLVKNHICPQCGTTGLESCGKGRGFDCPNCGGKVGAK